MPSVVIDGNDVVGVRAAIAESVDRARSGGGPTLVECKTVRWERHSALSAGADPDEGRRAWQRVDPISRYRKALLAWGVASEDALDAIDSEARDEAASARSLAERAPFPSLESVYEDIYAPATR
jgi:pyruvate dehydrogenase E1 component alpha subunit